MVSVTRISFVDSEPYPLRKFHASEAFIRSKTIYLIVMSGFGEGQTYALLLLIQSAVLMAS